MKQEETEIKASGLDHHYIKDSFGKLTERMKII